MRRIASSGRSNRPLGRTTGRVHHLLSDIERRSFLIYDRAENVTDIREQFPLDRTTTQRIAAEMGVRHPTYPGSNVPVVMTTDLLLDVRIEGRDLLAARAIKPTSALGDGRVLEKLEIERRFWAEREVDWGLVTERELPPVLIGNLEWLQGPWASNAWSGEDEARAGRFAQALPGFAEEPLRVFCATMEAELALQPGEALALVRRMIATRRWQADLSVALWDGEVRMGHFALQDSGDGRARA